MEPDSLITMPIADATFEEFAVSLPDFLPAVQDGFECIVDLAAEVNDESLGPDSVIAKLTGSLAEDLHDVLVLCSKDRRNGALRLLRTPFEKFLYASHISRHPKSAQDFVMYDAIQAKALLAGIEDHYKHKISDAGRAKIDEMFKIAQERFKRKKCKECGESGPRMWTKVTPEHMAKEAGLEDIHVLAYRYSTLMIHPSFRGLSDQMKGTLKMPAILFVIFKLTLETLKLQWSHFKRTTTVKGKTAVVMRRLHDAFKSAP